MSAPAHARQTAGPDSVEVTADVWLRNRRRTRAWAAIAAAWSVGFACLLFIPPNKTLAEYLALGAFYFGIAALGMLLARRVANAGVRIGPDGIVVRGPFRTRRVSIADAEVFVPGLQGGGGNGTPCPMLERRDGRPVGVWALGRRNLWFRYHRLAQEIQPLCDDLTALVKVLQSPSPPANPTPSLG
jgi:hypothetical protein